MTRTCGDSGGKTLAGALCRASLNLSPTSGLCWSHDPERAEQARAIRASGGVAAGRAKRLENAPPAGDVPNAPRTLADAEKLAAWLARAVLTGQIDSRTCESATKAVRQFQLTVEKRELQREVAGLRAQLAQIKRERST